MIEDPKAEDLRALMQSVEADTSRTSPNREQIRRSVLAAFDNATAVPVGNEPEIITLVSNEHEHERSTSRRRSFGWVVAAAAVFLAAIVLAPDSSGRLETAARTETGTLFEEGTELPATLLSGEQNQHSVAGGVSFAAPAGLAVIHVSERELILGLADDPEGSLGQLMFIEMELSDWEGLVRDLARSGDVSLKEIGVIVNGDAATRLDITITNEGLAERSCQRGEPCISLEIPASGSSAALWAGSDNRIVEIGRTEDSMVIAIEVSQQFQGPLSPLAAQVIRTASIEAE